MTAFTPTPENTRQLRDAYGRFATGVCIVTTHTDNGPVGMTVNSFSSVSLDPALVLWCPMKGSERTASFTGASHFAIHVLREDQGDLAMAFAKNGDAFAGLDIVEGMGGVPLLPDCCARFECEAAGQHEAGDHLIQVGQVLRAEFNNEFAPLIFAGGAFGGFNAV